jgi:alkaline phosphatase
MHNLRNKSYKQVLILTIILSIFFQTSAYIMANANDNNRNQVKNIILLIGDGMGTSHITLGRIYKGNNLHMNSMPYNGFATTHPIPQDKKWVTDSAAAGTALATGNKTYNGYISVDVDQKPLETILEKALKSDRSVGLVTTARITHATPAAFASHNSSRDAENQIAKEMIGKGINVLLGGGRGHFLPKSDNGKREDDKNLINSAKNLGYEYVESRKELNKINKGNILGLFNDGHMNYEIDRDKSNEPSIAEMTTKAVKLLNQNKKGFFLMVEGGRIDQASHANDPATAALDIVAFDDAVKVALDFAKKDKNTLVIVTADHETGGMSLGANGIYDFRPEELKKQKSSLEKLLPTLTEDNYEKEIKEKLGITLSEEENKEIINSFKEKEEITKFLTDIINKKSNTGWTSRGHTAADVPIKAYGPGAERFSTYMNNTDINKIMVELLNLTGRKIKRAA